MVKIDVNRVHLITSVLLVKQCLIVQHFSMLQIQLVIVNSALMVKIVDRSVLVQLTVLLVTTLSHLI